MTSTYTSMIARLFALVFIWAVGMSNATAEEVKDQGIKDQGIFERILEASGSFSDTTAALEKALAESKLIVHAKRDLTFTDKQQEARVYVLTSPAYMEAAAKEEPNTISAQILRIGVYQYGPGKPTHINIANPVAHAMVFYSKSKNYDALITAAQTVTKEFRGVASPSSARASPDFRSRAVTIASSIVSVANRRMYVTGAS